MRDRQLHQMHFLAFDVSQLEAFAFQHDFVAAVGIVAHDKHGGVDAAGAGNAERIHIGRDHTVELSGGVLVNRLDVIVELGQLDFDAVFVGPFLENPGLLGVQPGHKAGVNRPGEIELLFLRRVRATAERAGEEQNGSDQSAGQGVVHGSGSRLKSRVGGRTGGKLAFRRGDGPLTADE